MHTPTDPLTRQALDTPQCGAVSAATITVDTTGYQAFCATAIDLYRAAFTLDGFPDTWEQLPAVPLGILCLAASPQYASDRLLLAGSYSGISFSCDAGNTWHAAKIPMSQSNILCLGFSPQFAQDGILLAGTLEDGAFFSDDRGRTWSSRSFGMLDAAVYCLSYSPDFARDGIVYAGTDSALYYSYNHARAWRRLSFPEEAAPILSLAVSPNFLSDRTLFAGTESAGIYRSTDSGNTWTQVSPLNSIVSIYYSPDAGILAASTDGIYRSEDSEGSWQLEVAIPEITSLANLQVTWIAGTLNGDVWMKTGKMGWKRLDSPC